MPRPIAFASLAAACLLAPLPVFAGEVECHANKEYAVAVQSYDEDAGAQFAVTALKGKKMKCPKRFQRSGSFEWMASHRTSSEGPSGKPFSTGQR